MISFQFSVEANVRPALYCALGTNHTDPLSKSLSRFLKLFDQAKQHPFDLGDPGIQNCELLVGKQVQVSSKKNVVLQFTGRPKKDEENCRSSELAALPRPSVMFLFSQRGR